MEEFLTVMFWGPASFTVVDYVLGRATVRDPLRAAIAAVFSVLFVLFVAAPDLV